MRLVHTICLVLAILGALNWGLWGLLRQDLVATLFSGTLTPVSRVIYTVIGLAVLVLIYTSAVTYDRLRPVRWWR
jgi:hypothetical protein